MPPAARSRLCSWDSAWAVHLSMLTWEAYDIKKVNLSINRIGIFTI